MAVFIDFTKSVDENFYNLLTGSTTLLPAGTVLSTADIVYSDILVVDTDGKTSIKLTPVPTSTLIYGSEKSVSYTRQSLSGVLSSREVSLAVTDDLVNWTADKASESAIAYLLSGLNSAFTGELFLVGDPVTAEDGSIQVPVNASVNPVIFGSVTLVITDSNRVNTDSIPDDLGSFETEASGS